MPSLSSLVDRIGGRGASAWDIHTRAMLDRENGEDVIVFSVGDPDFDTPSKIVDSAKRALDDGDTHYMDVRGKETLRRLIAEQHTEKTGQQVTAQNIVIVPGAQCGLFCASLCVAESGNEIITTDPVYTTYEAAICATGAQMVTVAQRVDEGFRTDYHDLKSAITAKTRGIFLANPNNPTGVVLSDDEMQHIVDLACEHDLWIVADEVYADLVYEGEFKHFASIPEAQDRVISVSSFSKTFAMTGWRIGWIVAPEPVADHVENLLLSMLYGMPGFVQEAAITALSECKLDSLSMRDTYRNRRDLVLNALKEAPLIKCQKPMSGMFLLVDIRETALSSAEFVVRLYEATGVAVLDGGAFGSTGEGFVRISFTNSEEDLLEGSRRIVQFVTETDF
jgi:aspartate/methionine/tyrosine aminotransferase